MAASASEWVSGTQGDNARWWDAFHDPELSRLETEGRVANLDIAMALSRLRQSREALVQARSANLPTISALGRYTRTQAIAGPAGSPPSADGLSLTADAAYQLDIFGGRRRGIEAAGADAEASGFDPVERVVNVPGRPDIPFDLLSVDVGGIPAVPGAGGIAVTSTNKHIGNRAHTTACA